MTTEHWTGEIRKSYAVRYANALLRDVGMRDPSPSLRGAAVYAKAAMALVHRKVRRKPHAAVAACYDFKLDAETLGKLVDLPPAIAAE